jgi:hypothetical protein
MYVARRALRRTCWAFAVVLLLPVLQLLPFLQERLSGSIRFWFAVLFPTAVYVLNCRREARRMRDCGYRVCTNCRYSLEGVADSGKCPECGERYDIRAAHAQWGNEAADD